MVVGGDGVDRVGLGQGGVAGDHDEVLVVFRAADLEKLWLPVTTMALSENGSITSTLLWMIA